MKLGITLGELAGITGGKLIKGNPAEIFDSFASDTRKAGRGCFFWAFRGKKHDAHDFLTPETARLCKGWIIQENRLPSRTPLPENVLAVDDTLKALHRLAKSRLMKFRPLVVGITGSNGKTTTKEIIRSIFSLKGETLSTEGNFNNEFGMPLTALELSEKHKYAVFEMGASRKGDIKTLGEIARPDIAVLTNISAAHLEFFKSMETVFQAKSEIIESMKEGGVFVYNADDPYLSSLKRRREKKISFSETDGDILLKGEKNRLTLSLPGNGKITAVMPAKGLHNFYNAAAAAGAALAAGFSAEEIKRGIENHRPPPGRLEIFRTGKMTVIFDAYNANPGSMDAAFRTLTEGGFPRPFHLVLGDMKELGAYSYLHHSNLAEKIAGIKPEYVFLAGDEMKAAYDKLAENGGPKTLNYSKDAEWADEVARILRTGSGTMLVKASRAMGFERFFSGIRKR